MAAAPILPPLDCQCNTEPEFQGLSGFAMPDPYTLGEFIASVLPNDPTPDDIMEALSNGKSFSNNPFSCSIIVCLHPSQTVVL